MMTDSEPTPYAEPALETPRYVSGPLYLTGEDGLRLTVLNAKAGVTVRLAGRFLPVCGRVTPFVHDLVPATDRSSSTRSPTLGEGWLLEATIHVSAGSALIGQCFAQLTIVRGDGSAAITLAQLAQGYITSTQRIGWQLGRVTTSLDGPGALRSITGTTPAPGAEISETVPTGARWQLISFTALLTTSAAVANRVPELIVDDGANTLILSSQMGNQAASLAWTYLWAPGDQNQAAGNRLIVTASLPQPVYLGAGYRLRTNTQAIQAADQWSAVQYAVTEWIEGA